MGLIEVYRSSAAHHNIKFYIPIYWFISIVLRSYGYNLVLVYFLENIKKHTSSFLKKHKKRTFLNVPRFKGEKHWSFGTSHFALKCAFTNIT